MQECFMSANIIEPNITDVQNRVANTSIGASTLRRQGPSGMVKASRQYLAQLDLKKLNNITESQFQTWLAVNTENLMKKFPKDGEPNWGAARKAMNIFLENAFYDRFLAKCYNLQKLEKYLELPLDNSVVKGLKKDSEAPETRHTMPKWSGIKHLNVEDSDKFQYCAKMVADKIGTTRIFLDLRYWRPQKADGNK
jgi:hypothetical protein